MATLNATNLKHASSGSNNIVLASDGSTTISNLSGGVGKILQVVQTEKTDTFSCNSDSFTDLTGLSVTITPTSTSSKILFTATLCFGMSADGYGSGRLVRDSTPLGVAAADGNRTVCGFAMQMNLNANNKLYTLTYQYLDSPNTTSATTYKLQARTYTGDSRYFTINRTGSDSNLDYNHRGESRVIAMEVAG